MKTVGGSCEVNWQKVFSQVNRAVVFIDNVCAELLHWQGGLPQLIKAGATDVKEFSSFEVRHIKAVKQKMFTELTPL